MRNFYSIKAQKMRISMENIQSESTSGKGLSQWEGSKALEVLRFHKNTPIYCIHLNNLMDAPNMDILSKTAEHMLLESDSEEDGLGSYVKSYNVMDYIHNAFSNGIPLSDTKTVRDVYRRINTLSEAKSIRISEEIDTSDIDIEIKALKKYLSETIRPGGVIKEYLPEEKKAYQRINKAISRYIKEAEKTDPIAASIIRKSLTQGRYFTWAD